MSTADGGIVAALGTSVARGLAIHARQPGKGLAMPRLALIAPREVGPSPWFPRNQKTPAAQEQSEVLLASIRHFGGNLQPIKVRPVCQRDADERETRFELVYGGRRLQACAELNLPVLALIDTYRALRIGAVDDAGYRKRGRFHCPGLKRARNTWRP